jgi:hypothetical protein
MADRSIWIRALLLMFVGIGGPGLAVAQPAYVGASLVGHVARFASVESEALLRSGDFSADGESLGFGLVVGTALAERWGVEFEFVRPGVLERSERSEVLLPPALPQPLPFPIIEYEFHAEERHTTMTAAAWFRQRIGDRAELAYLGGVAFVRTTREQSIGIDPRILALSIPIEQETTEHTVGPMVGLEGRIRLTPQIALTPGIRLMAVTAGGRDGWLIRPGVGIHWIF